jgi:predicted O-linked N-acetylglucosamine transferase (SPINDLY family)
MEEQLYRYGIDLNRVIIHEPFTTKDELLKTISECDIYLDSYPYSGMTSIIDPITVGLPIIASEGLYQRERMSSSSLQSLGLYDWITEDNEAYVSKAVYLAKSRIARNEMSIRLSNKLKESTPTFLDSYKYSQDIGNIFSKILDI